jgi:superfamily II DNA or RNA helicase
VVLNTKDLMEQWEEKILEHTDVKPEEIGRLQGKRADWEGKKIVLASIQTLAKRIADEQLPEDFGDYFGVVIYDEVHHLGAPYFNQTAPVVINNRWGLTATPERGDGLDAFYQGHLGPVLYENLHQDLIPECYFMHTGLPLTHQAKKQVYVGETINFMRLCQYLAESKTRNAFIEDLIHQAVDEGRKILCLTHLVDHLLNMHGRFSESGVIHGKVKAEDRRKVLAEKDLIFATLSLAKEGLDRPDLDTVMILLPIKKKGVLQQIIGRIQRAHPGKVLPVVVIVFEDEKIHTTRRQAGQLRNHLTSFGYDFKIVRNSI